MLRIEVNHEREFFFVFSPIFFQGKHEPLVLLCDR